MFIMTRKVILTKLQMKATEQYNNWNLCISLNLILNLDFSGSG